MFDRRIKLLKHILEKRGKLDIKTSDLIYNVFGPASRYKARPFLRTIGDVEGEFRPVYFYGHSEPLYIPAHIDPGFIYQVTCELFRPQEWHYYEIPQTKVEPHDYVLDAGAAEGLFTFLIANRCTRVYTVEPLPSFVSSLKKTFERQTNVEVMPYALGSEIGKASLHGDGITTEVQVDERGEIAVTTVDELIIKQNRPLSYIKADLEGYERSMLAGAKESIIKYKPKIAITTYHKRDDHLFIMDFLNSLDLGYTFICCGVEERWGQPVMLHAWVSE